MCLKAQLTPRQWDVAQRVVQGDENPEIAKHLEIALTNVRGRVRQACDKLGVCNRTMLAVAIVRHDYECDQCKGIHD